MIRVWRSMAIVMNGRPTGSPVAWSITMRSTVVWSISHASLWRSVTGPSSTIRNLWSASRLPRWQNVSV